MKLMRDMRDRIHTVGTWSRDLLTTVRELTDGIRSIDRERIPDPKKAIQALRSAARTVRKAGSEEINAYPISNELKQKLEEFIEEFYEEENHEQ